CSRQFSGRAQGRRGLAPPFIPPGSPRPTGEVQSHSTFTRNASPAENSIGTAPSANTISFTGRPSPSMSPARFGSLANRRSAAPLPLGDQDHVGHAGAVPLDERQPAGEEERPLGPEPHFEVVRRHRAGVPGLGVRPVDPAEERRPLVPPTESGAVVGVPRVAG